MMVEMELLWEDKGWSVGEGFISRLTYISSILARELCVRVGEVAMPGTKGKRSCDKSRSSLDFIGQSYFCFRTGSTHLRGGGSAILKQLRVDMIAATEIKAVEAVSNRPGVKEANYRRCYRCTSTTVWVVLRTA